MSLSKFSKPIALCLLTADRYQYTERTLRTLAQHNDLSKFVLLHADDASEDRDVVHLAQSYGFSTVVQSTIRQGWRILRPKLFEVAARHCEWVWFLENDHESVRPFPWTLFRYIDQQPNVYCLRLFGAYKDRERRDACMVYHKTDRRKPVKWKRLKHAPEPCEATWIHWSAQPSVTKVDALLDLHRYGMESGDLTVRVVENVTYHIGLDRTHEVKV